jgi:UDP-N-acetyl-D-mannosaminuronic acid dehydrogenase
MDSLRLHVRSIVQSSEGELDLVVVGGCGHVGLPLALCFADSGATVGIYDADRAKVDQVSAGQMPFCERDADALLERLLPTGRLIVSDRPELIQRTAVVVMVIGTPLDEFMSPTMRVYERAIDQLAAHVRNGALIILRSTVYPGTTEMVDRRLADHGLQVDVAFCPERIAEGYALEEIRTLPQLIGCDSDIAFDRARATFERLGVEIMRSTPEEAELTKLLTNTWRYMKFAIANQFFEITHRAGVDYGHVLHNIRYRYPRAADLPGPGFAAGPCLLKDTIQLAAFTPDHFPMGHSAMLINEGLPGYIIDQLHHRRPLTGRTVGILGMAFKAESDDPRSSLSYKLKKLAGFKGARVLCTDPYVKDPSLSTLDDVIRESDVIIIGAPHHAYRGLQLQLEGREIVDVWDCLGDGIRL